MEQEYLKNINILNFMKNNTVLSIKTFRESVLLKGISDRRWVYISSSSEDDLRVLKNNLDTEDTCFGAVEEWMLPIILEERELLWDLSMVQYYLPNEVELPKYDQSTVTLSLADAKTVYEKSEYREMISLEYVKDRIERGISVGLFENNKLVAWAMTQDDGGMGFLHVLKTQREKGYGFYIMLALIEKVRRAGKLPFVYIEKDNTKSIKLIQKLGFKKEKKIHWLQLK